MKNKIQTKDTMNNHSEDLQNRRRPGTMIFIAIASVVFISIFSLNQSHGILQATSRKMSSFHVVEYSSGQEVGLMGLGNNDISSSSSVLNISSSRKQEGTKKDNNALMPSNALDDDREEHEKHPEKNDNESYYDFIFWSETKTPMLLAPSITHQDFIVSLRYTSPEPLSSFRQVLRVDFRTCEKKKSNCPVGTIMEKHEANANVSLPFSNLTNYLQSKQFKSAIIHVEFTNSSSWKQKIDPSRLRTVTFWSDELQQYIPLDATALPNDTIQFGSCNPRLTCPLECPRPSIPNDSPYMFDPVDRICKSTHPEALLRQFAGPCKCETTCFTKDVGIFPSTWPWKDAKERMKFQPFWNDTERQSRLNQKYRDAEKSRITSKEFVTYKRRFACNESKTPNQIFGAFSHHLFFIPEAKMIFCGIPKVGMTEWIKFIRFSIGAKDYLSLPHFKLDRQLFMMKSLPFSTAQQLLNDPTWTKAVFIRNPFERLLSAYEDKIVGMSYTQKTFGIGTDLPKNERPTLSFPEFVDKVTATEHLNNCSDPTGLKACTDPHWRPQLMMCGLDHLLPKFDFIGNFDHISKHTEILLKKTGVWEKHGLKFDDGKGMAHANMCRIPYPVRPDNFTLFGFNQRGPSGVGKNLHATNSKAKFDKMYTPELLQKVQDAYEWDVAIWNEISKKFADSIANGKDLEIVRNFCSDDNGK